MLLEKEQELERLRVQHEREIYLMKKKLSTAAAPTRPLPAPAALINLSIPRYHTVSRLLNLLLVTSVIQVGSGKAGYVEYEVNIGFHKETNFNSFYMADSSGEWRW